MRLDDVIRNPWLIGVCGATPSEIMRREVRGIRANGRHGFFEKGGEKRGCDGGP